MTSFFHAVSAEFRKLSSTRTWLGLGLGLLAYLALATIGVTFAFNNSPGPLTRQGITLLDPVVHRALYGSTLPLGYVFALLFGGHLVLAERTYRTLTGTYLAIPNRRITLAAKAFTALLGGWLLAIPACALTVAAVLATLSGLGQPSAVSLDQVWPILLHTVVAFGLWATLGVAIATVLRRPIVVVIVVVLSTQLLEPLLRVALTEWSPTRTLVKFFPTSATESFLGTSLFGLSYPSTFNVLPPATGLALLIAYVLLGMLISSASSTRAPVR